MDIALDEVTYFDAITSDPTDGSAVDADSAPTFEIFEEATDSPIVSGTFTKRTSKTGDYRGTTTISLANGYEIGKWYSIIATAIVNGVTGKGVIRNFRVCADESIAGFPSIGSAIVVGDVSGNVDGNVQGDIAGNVDGMVFGGIGGDVAGNISGKVIGGGAGTITGTGVRAIDGSGNAIAPASATTAIAAAIAALFSAAQCNKVADHVKRRTQANVQASADGDAISKGSDYGAIQQMQKSNVTSNTLTIKNPDGTTLGTLTLTSSAGADPVTGIQ